jgi:hypothetical protein
MALNNAYKMYGALINKWTPYGRQTLDMGDAVRELTTTCVREKTASGASLRCVGLDARLGEASSIGDSNGGGGLCTVVECS